MALPDWAMIVGGVVLQTAGATAFAFQQFSTKKELKETAEHLSIVNDAKQATLVAKLDHLHECMHELKEIIQEQMEWKK